MIRSLRIFEAEARSILSSTTGFIAEAGFTHSLTPARNCTYGCTYCYVPTLHIYAGLKKDDWQHWGQFTTFKDNAPQLLARELRPDQIIYCSPLVDPYQPAEQERELMPGILDALIESPPRIFVIQTRGPLITRDIERLRLLSMRAVVRVSFSLTTDREEVRRVFEPHCEPLQCRLDAMRQLRDAGINTFATLAPLLPSNPEFLASVALEATTNNLIGDPLHVRSVKRMGATTRPAAWKIGQMHGFAEWFEPAFQAEIIRRIQQVAAAAGRSFEVGPEGFSWLIRS